MYYKKSEKGQALVLIALAIVGLTAFTALAIDGGMVLSDRRHAQNAADTAVLAAALAKVRNQDYQAAALARASSNGYANDADSIVQVNLCSDSGITCDGMPAGANPADYIKVTIISNVKTTFARIIGRTDVTNRAEAIARTQGATAGGPSPLGSGLATLSPTSDKALDLNGNATLNILNSGTFVNSGSQNCAMSSNGNLSLSVTTSYTMVGLPCENGNINRVGEYTQGSQIAYPPAITVPAPSIVCTGVGYQSGSTYYPGIWSNKLLFNSNGNVTLMPGNYCLAQGAEINGNANVTANDVNINLIGGQFLLNGSGSFTCSNMILYSNGGSGFRVNGAMTTNCNGVVFYARTGEILWNGNVQNTLKAHSSGPYKGLLIYQPVENPTKLIINGNAGNQLSGTILAVSAPIEWNGNQGTEVLHSQVIGYTIKFNGNGTIVLDYNADENYFPPNSPSITLIK